ncbi:hypothetical protein HC256_006198 [Beauveria bassiana]|nr:hypothetical protein HC256_006198 [Beauveria bassiana]
MPSLIPLSFANAAISRNPSTAHFHSSSGADVLTILPTLPAIDVVLFQKCSGFFYWVLIWLTGQFNARVAETTETIKSLFQWLWSHPSVCGEMHTGEWRRQV